MVQELDLVRPAPALAPLIDKVRVFEPVSERRLQVERFPDGTTSLLFRVTAHGGRKGDLCIAGPRSRALFKLTPPVELCVEFQFKPGGAVPFLGIAASEIADCVVSLEDVWGAKGRDVHQRLLAARSASEVVHQLQHVLLARASRRFESTSTRLARRAARLLEERHDLRIEDVAARLGVTARHLRRVFIENVGVGPKQFARMLRLRRAMRAASASLDWARIAADAGYYDQAHLISDFHEFVGITPNAFIQHAAERAVRLASRECLAA